MGVRKCYTGIITELPLVNWIFGVDINNEIVLVSQEKKSWLQALKDIKEAARAGTTPVRALLAERGMSDEKTGVPRTTLRDVEKKMKSIRVKPESVNPKATKDKAAAVKQVRL